MGGCLAGGLDAAFGRLGFGLDLDFRLVGFGGRLQCGAALASIRCASANAALARARCSASNTEPSACTLRVSPS